MFILKNLKLYDTPGIVAAASNPPASMALRSLQVEEGEENALEAVRTLLKQCDKVQVRRLGSTYQRLVCTGNQYIVWHFLGCF